MILPVVAYGHPVLRKVCDEITPDYPGLEKLIADMWETVYNSNGVGLAAPQINKPIRLFIIDTVQIVEDFDADDKAKYPGEEPVKQIFINAHKIEETGETWAYNEGCLSIPGIHETVLRAQKIKIKYVDSDFNEHIEEFEGFKARVVQHEYDHLEGHLFTDKVTPIRRQLLKSKLTNIVKGKSSASYKIKSA